MQKYETRPPTYIIHKNKLKWIKDLNVHCETIKILEKNIGNKISDIACSNTFSDIYPWAREQRKQKRLHQTKKLLHN